MKLYINYKIKDSGKGKFLKKLIPCLEDLGVKCSFKYRKADISLGIRYWRGKVDIPKVLRIDGIYLWKNKSTFWRNNLTKKAIKHSDAVIWQSAFCKKMVSGILGVKPKQEFVIFNGADPREYRGDKLFFPNGHIAIVPWSKSPVKRTAKYHVIMSARWKGRPWKRLKDCIRVAREARTHEDIYFWVAGKYDKDLSEKGIKFLGHLDERKLRRYLAASDAMLNLSYNDWCPNAVVEALCAGLPIIGNNCSGIGELVGENSTIIDVDPEPRTRYLSADKPPRVDVKLVAGSVIDVLHNSNKKVIDKLNIRNIAEQYKLAFEEVLSAQ